MAKERFDLGKLLRRMEERMDLLKYHIDRDFGGGMADRVAKFMETKYWYEAILRNEFGEVNKNDLGTPN